MRRKLFVAACSEPKDWRMIPPASSFTYTNRFDDEEAASVARLLAEKGVRRLPYPFGSAVAVVSDIDGSSRARYAGYIGALVEELGLDFGDSIWLRRRVRGIGLGFLSRRFTMHAAEEEPLYDATHTFNENVIEFHKGNVDHFHSFLAVGPRVVLCERMTVQGDHVQIVLDEFQSDGPWSCAVDIQIVALCIVSSNPATADVRSIGMRERDGTLTTAFKPCPYDAPHDGLDYQLFVLDGDAVDAPPPPTLRNLASVAIQVAGGAASSIRRVLLLNASGQQLIDRLTFLREGYNIETNLVTEHRAVHFRNPAAAVRSDAQMQEHIRVHRGPVEAYNGSLRDDRGGLVFSTDSDEPHSLGRVFPALTETLEVRFIVPIAARSTFGWSPFEVVVPSPTRSGTGVYWAHRVKPNAGPPLPGSQFDGPTRHDTFVHRIGRILDDSESTPGLCWPLYTHLGNGLASLPSPYFEPAGLRAFQDRVFNITGGVPAKARLWCTRATVLYDYALMLRSLGGHVERVDANTVQVESWLDTTLNKTLPRCKAQLYGVTFYVDEPARAKVWLDGERITALARNPPDETGRPSVTVAEAEIEHTLFERLDPAANLPDHVVLEGGQWSWNEPRDERPAFGRLTIGASPPGARTAGRPDAAASIELPLCGLAPNGAQLLRFDLRLDRGSSFGLILETLSGGRFFFGTSEAGQDLGHDVTARYLFDHIRHPHGQWQELVVPFCDLAWSQDALPGGPMPNHALKSLTIVARGSAAAGADIARMVFLRPRATALYRKEGRTYCLGGKVPAFQAGQRVHIRATEAKEATSIRTETVDSRGAFCARGLEKGIYEAWTTRGEHRTWDRRGRLVELGTNVTSLILDREAP
jgi:hypothetical protein